jgi:hypothetical protein
MSKVTLDNGLLVKHEPLEICDEGGQTVGHFLPPGVYKKFVYAALAAECPYSAEDLARMQQETGGRPLAELWRELGAG